MAHRIDSEDLMKYLDGELTPEERARIDAALADSTELRREMAIFRALKTDFQELSFHAATYRVSVWDDVNAHLTRPMGWILVVVGVALWMSYGAYVFATSAVDPWSKLATGAISIGVLTLLASVIWERLREWEHDPYRHIHR